MAMTADSILCIGDIVAFFAADIRGYMYSKLSSSAETFLAVKSSESQSQPQCPDVQVISFKICMANRYKLQKKYKRLAAIYNDSSETEHLNKLMEAKIAATAEEEDNVVEQKRQKGKRVLYGQVVQLQHVFTGKFVHISTQNASPTESSNMQVTLNSDNAAFALFRVMPRFKVKGEGDLVQFEDQVVLESVKCPGQFLHVSLQKFGSYLPVYSGSHEVNLCVKGSGFTLVKRYRDTEENANKIRAGQPIRFFHTELEAYLVCEGTFKEALVEDVHLRIRAHDQSKPKTLYRPSSAICYWQLEFMDGCVSGEVIKWEQQVRIRHMCTRKYLSVDINGSFTMTDDLKDTRAVFRLFPVIKEGEEIEDATYCQIEHHASKSWLHASKDAYIRHALAEGSDSSNSMSGLVWSQAPLRKVELKSHMRIEDAFTIQAVEPELLNIFNYVAGFVPLIQAFIRERRKSISASYSLTANRCNTILTALKQLSGFMEVNGQGCKKRQKLLRNLQVVDLLVRLLQTPIRDTIDNRMMKIFVACYNVLYSYLMNESRKNELYIAKYLDFFRSQVKVGEQIGVSAVRLFMAVIWDNRKIIDRVPRSCVDEFISLLKQKMSYFYLELLSVLCVCNKMCMPDNQNYIAEKWLVEGQDSSLVLITELGQKIGRKKDKVYVSIDKRRSWVTLSQFADDAENAFKALKLDETDSASMLLLKSSMNSENQELKASSEEEHMRTAETFLFLKYQLDMFGKLCQGRNANSIEVITKKLNYLSWKEAFICLTDEDLPDQLRAKYCELITIMFIDVDDNINVLDKINLTFVYSNVSKDWQMPIKRGEGSTRKLAPTQNYFPLLRDWLATFLEKNHDMTASDIGHNMLLTCVLQMLHFLVNFGYYNSATDITKLLKPLLFLLDGRNDKPLPNCDTPEYEVIRKAYLSGDRYRESKETKAIVGAKYQAMRVLDLFFNFRFNIRLKRFVAEFKEIQSLAKEQSGSLSREPLVALLAEDYEVKDDVASEACSRLAKIFDEYSFFKDYMYTPEVNATENFNTKSLHSRISALTNSSSPSFNSKHSYDIVSVLFDLSEYEYPIMVQMSMWLLNRYFSAHNLLFSRAGVAQVLITDKSVAVHSMVESDSQVMRRLISSKMTKSDIENMCAIIRRLCEVCHLEGEPDERHPINQAILYNSGILNDIFDLISQDVDINLSKLGHNRWSNDVYSGLRRVFSQCFNLLRLMAKGNRIVQTHIFERLDTLLNCMGAETELAQALTEVFTDDKDTCMKIRPHHISKTMALIAQHGTKVPEFFDMLNAVVKIEELDLPVRRNQDCVITFFKQQRKLVAQFVDQSKAAQLRLLRSANQSAEADFLAALVDLLATCAEGENQPNESFNQTMYAKNEVLQILTDLSISNRYKRPFARFLLWSYLNTASGFIETGVGDLAHDADMWKLLSMMREELTRMTDLTANAPQLVRHVLKTKMFLRSAEQPLNSTQQGKIVKTPQSTPMSPESIHETLRYLFEGALPVISIFFRRVFRQDHKNHPKELDELNSFVKVSMCFADIILPLVFHEKYRTVLRKCMLCLLEVSNLPEKVHEEYQKLYVIGVQGNRDMRSDARMKYDEYYAAEGKLNMELSVFAKNYCLSYGGKNTVRAQIGFASDAEYTEIGCEEELPLGKEFQDHLSCFIDPKCSLTHPSKFKWAGKLVEQLHVSNQTAIYTEKERIERQILDVKSLQLLRAIVHNEIIKLPTNIDSAAYKQVCQNIALVQNALNGHDAMLKVLPNLTKDSDIIVHEVLSFLANMLFNGNTLVQGSLLEYFRSTREEKFFVAVKDRINRSSLTWRENRGLIFQQQGKFDETADEMRFIYKAFKDGIVTADELKQSRLGSKLHEAMRNKSTANGVKGNGKNPSFRLIRRNHSRVHNFSNYRGPLDSMTAVTYHPTFVDEIDIRGLAQQIDLDKNALQLKDDGYIELVLRVLAYICDGQNSKLQDYIREQPDNIKSIDLVAETTWFLGLIYTSISRTNMSLIIQVFQTLVEFASGNLKNQVVCYDNKVCDYINYLLRSNRSFRGCDLEEEMELKHAMANLIIAMCEEDLKRDRGTSAGDISTAELQRQAKPSIKAGVAAMVKDIIDTDSICNIFSDCYSRAIRESNDDQRELIMKVGFRYFYIFLRFEDLDNRKYIKFKKLLARRKDSEVLREAYDYYQERTQSIEVMKDGNLQKVYFRVKENNVLREEVKDRFKYAVDRSSTANKLRDFHDWMREIIKDIKWQKRVLSNPLGVFFVHAWKPLNIVCIVLSMVICVIVLSSWLSPKDPQDMIPVRSKSAVVATYILGVLHNIISLFILISFFLCNKPYVPSMQQIKLFWCKTLCIESPLSEADEDHAAGKLQASIFSFHTFYYAIFFVFSILGTLFYGYFFAFHLLHIANHNQLLRRVFQAITKNGLSLLWVMVYSLAFFYIYALISFAFYREYFGEKGNYCENMFQCTVTVVRRGLIVGMYDEADYFSVPENRTFEAIMAKTVFDISFFIIITVIGLNIVFGIIVDTFSELRDAKWQVDRDESSICFICSRNSYDFEHYGKGFEKHVQNEHNRWAYLFFILHLQETRVMDFTALEFHVWRLYLKDRLDFYPINKSLTLQAAEEGSEEVKMETLMSQVAFLVTRWKEEDASRARQREKRKQQEWEERHTKMLEQLDETDSEIQE